MVDLIETLQSFLEFGFGVVHEMFDHTGVTAPEILLKPGVDRGDHQVAAIDVHAPGVIDVGSGPFVQKGLDVLGCIGLGLDRKSVV